MKTSLLLRSSFLLSTLSAALNAQAALITIDNPNLVVVGPASGSQTYTITGSYTLDVNDQPVGGGSTTFPSTSSGATLQVAPTDAFSDAVFRGQRSYTGTLATFTIDPSTPEGVYDRFGAVRLVYRVGTDPTFITANGPFTISVTQPVPEPATLAALGIGALALVRRGKARA